MAGSFCTWNIRSRYGAGSFGMWNVRASMRQVHLVRVMLGAGKR